VVWTVVAVAERVVLSHIVRHLTSIFFHFIAFFPSASLVSVIFGRTLRFLFPFYARAEELGCNKLHFVVRNCN
jgi:hypothetical protein